MPNSHPDESPVTWGRYQAAHDALEARVAGCEAATSRLPGIETDLASLKETAGRRRERSWALWSLILAGLALPVLVILIGILINRLAGG